MNSICFNGKIMNGTEPVLMASNRGYRYGDGLFETMKVVKDDIRLYDYHFQRLFSSLSLLKFEVPPLFTPDKIKKEIALLCQKNNCEKLARVRLSVFRGNGGLYDDSKVLEYLIECFPLNDSVNNLNENGLVIDVYTDAQKSCDQFSNLKSANFLPYSMAALYAKQHRWNDCLILNTAGNIADSTIANLFIIKNETICTPGLQEGCINGVMRRHLLEKLKTDYTVQEQAITIANLEEADEIFLTNAINGIRWVKQFRNKEYGCRQTTDIFNKFIRTI